MKQVRRCRCGCGLAFEANPTSRKIYYNRKHKRNAKHYRDKLKAAGVALPPELPSPYSEEP